LFAICLGLFSRCLSPANGDACDVLEGEDEEEEEEEDEEEEEGAEGAVLKNCFLAMVDTLAKQVTNPSETIIFHDVETPC